MTSEATTRREFSQVHWDDRVSRACRELIRLSVSEDLGSGQDWTTACLVPSTAHASATIVAREPGVVSGMPAAELALAEFDKTCLWQPLISDGAKVTRGTQVARMAGPARSLLTAERSVLNFLGHLSGISTLAARFVEQTAGTQARIYDTRKTAPGWRLLEKYAVRAGGGHNHRTGLYDAILIKDNHLAFGGTSETATSGFTPADAVARARQFAAHWERNHPSVPMLVEVEVDNLLQLSEVLPQGPDVVLLDNMTLEMLREAVAMRNQQAPGVELEASGGVRLETVKAIAETGVDRISAGALTHSYRVLDLGLDWDDPRGIQR